MRQGVRGSIVGTVLDVDEARRQLQVAADDDRSGRVTIVTDAVSTQYNGFGGMINGQPEIFVGSTGFANLRLGDRVEVRGVGQSGSSVAAEHVTLLGRTVAAPQTGVGSTRPPGSVSTPTATMTVTEDAAGRIEGTVRSVNTTTNTVVIETDRREVLTIFAAPRTPVIYQNRTYELGNLERGDRIRIDAEPGTSAGRELRARSIEVTRTVQESENWRGVGSVSGRVTRIDRTADTVWVAGDRGEVRVDLSRANDPSGNRVRAANVRVGDLLEITGSYSGNVYVATTVRSRDDVFADTPGASGTSVDATEEFVTVTLSATVVESLQTSPLLVVRERAGGRTTSIYVTEDFVTRTRSGGYTTADRIKVGDQLLIRAYRDSAGNLIAQTIRYR